MSTKFVLFAVATAVVCYGLLHRAPPSLVPEETRPGAMSFVKSVPARAKFGFGSAGVFVIGGIVRNMSEGTEKELKDMSTALKKKWGRDGDTARKAAETAWTLDSTSLEALKASKPVLAMNSAMKAKNFVQVARSNLVSP